MMVDRPRGSTNGTSSSARGSVSPVEAAGAGAEARAQPQAGATGEKAEEGRNRGRGGGAGVGAGAGGAEAEARPEGGRKNITAREVARQVYAESGLRGFYRGFGISVLQFAPTSAVSSLA